MPGRHRRLRLLPPLGATPAIADGEPPHGKDHVMDAEELKGIAMSRRSALKKGAATAFLLSQAALFEQLASPLVRPASAATAFSDIQFDMGAFINPAQVFNDGAGNVTAQFAPTYALLQPVTLNRTPTKADQITLANALNTIEASYPANPSGVLIFSVSYGLPYFNRLPQSVVRANMPTTVAYAGLPAGRPVLVEAVPSPTDVVGGLVGGPNAPIPGITKDRFNVNVAIENNDMLFEIRSDSMVNLSAIPLWFQGSNNLNGRGVPSPNFNGLFTFQAPRIQFVQIGLPRKMAVNYGFQFASQINPNSSMAMGFVDQQNNASGPAAITTFVGNSSAKLTNATIGSYFDNGSIAHFSHDIEDLYQFYLLPNQDPRHPDGESFQERCQYMFRTTSSAPLTGYLPSATLTSSPTAAARRSSTTSSRAPTPRCVARGTARACSSPAIRRSTPRSPAWAGSATRRRCSGYPGRPIARRCTYATTARASTAWTCPPSGPCRPSSNMPAGSAQFKLQFLVYVPTADFFASMRFLQAAQDFQKQFLGGATDDNGLERFITATRRQNFLVPPRRHRAFPLLELT